MSKPTPGLPYSGLLNSESKNDRSPAPAPSSAATNAAASTRWNISARRTIRTTRTMDTRSRRRWRTMSSRSIGIDDSKRGQARRRKERKGPSVRRVQEQLWWVRKYRASRMGNEWPESGLNWMAVVYISSVISESESDNTIASFFRD